MTEHLPGVPRKDDGVDGDPLRAIWKAINELRQRDLSNSQIRLTPGAQFSVQDDAGNPVLQVGPAVGGRAPVSILDSFGAKILDNNNTSGWGANTPNVAIPVFDADMNGDPRLQVHEVSTEYEVKLMGFCQVTHPRLLLILDTFISGPTTIGEVRVRWVDPWNDTRDTIWEPGPRPDGGHYVETVEYIFPQSAQNKLVRLDFEVKMTAGTNNVDWVSSVPYGIIMTGD